MHYIAPVQGHTDAAWRRLHSMAYNGDMNYITPFIRIEKGMIRLRDMRDYTSDLNDGVAVGPQVIFNGTDELRILLQGLAGLGTQTVNLNMGCPFPMQTGRGRGAAILSCPGSLDGLDSLMTEFAPMRFSVKMRLGYDNPGQWRKLMPLLNSVPLDFIAVHPRTGRQQYSGELNMVEFEALLGESAAPVVFNGGLRSPGDIADVKARYPRIAGVMAARGILGRPSLFEEYDAGREFPTDERIGRMLLFHDRLLAYYTGSLCGEAQILSKIKPVWEDAEGEIGHKAFKAIRKAGSMAKYRTAISGLEWL